MEAVMLCEKCGIKVSEGKTLCAKCERSVNARSCNTSSLDMEGKLFYTHSGKIAPHLVIGVPILLIVFILLAFVYAYAVVYIPLIGYLNILLTAGFALGVGFSTGVVLQFFKTRNSTFALCFGLIAGLIALYAAWVTFEYVFLNKVADEKVDLIRIADPRVLWNVACLIAENGWYSMRSFTPKGAVLWSFWGVEACIIAGVPAYMAHSFIKDAVFCESCKGWTDDHKSKLIFEYLSEGELKEKLTAQDMSFLDNTLKVERTAESFYRIDCTACCSCENHYTLSLLRVTRTWDNEGKETDKEQYILKNLYISKATFDKLSGARPVNAAPVNNDSGEDVTKETAV